MFLTHAHSRAAPLAFYFIPGILAARRLSRTCAFQSGDRSRPVPPCTHTPNSEIQTNRGPERHPRRLARSRPNQGVRTENHSSPHLSSFSAFRAHGRARHRELFAPLSSLLRRKHENKHDPRGPGRTQAMQTQQERVDESGRGRPQFGLAAARKG